MCIIANLEVPDIDHWTEEERAGDPFNSQRALRKRLLLVFYYFPRSNFILLAIVCVLGTIFLLKTIKKYFSTSMLVSLVLPLHHIPLVCILQNSSQVSQTISSGSSSSKM